MTARRYLIWSAALLALVLLPTTAAEIIPAPSSQAGADAVAAAISQQESLVVGGSWVRYPAAAPNPVLPGSPIPAAAIADAPITAEFEGGPPFVILTNGDASQADRPQSQQASTSHAAATTYRGAYDVLILRLDLLVPAEHDCLRFDFQFLSEEFPDFLNQAYNDAFLAELDQSTWQMNEAQLHAPDNFAFDPSGNPITINAAGAASMTGGHAQGSVYGGATPHLTAQTPVTPGGSHVLYLTIFDSGDAAYDSAAFIADLRSVWVGGTTGCEEGVIIPTTPPTAAFTSTPSGSLPLPVGTQMSFTDVSTPGQAASLIDWQWELDGVVFHEARTGASILWDSPGTFDVTLRVTQTGGESDTVTRTYTVYEPQPPPPPPNRAPQMDAVPDRTATEGETVSFGVKATDPDGDTLVLTASGLPTGATFTDQGSGSGSFTWATQQGDAGEYAGIRLRATESGGEGLWTERLVTVRVVIQSEPPSDPDKGRDGSPDYSCPDCPEDQQSSTGTSDQQDASDGDPGGCEATIEQEDGPVDACDQPEDDGSGGTGSDPESGGDPAGTGSSAGEAGRLDGEAGSAPSAPQARFSDPAHAAPALPAVFVFLAIALMAARRR